jgi:glycosyltransferase involved in cell wall biosynthesis
VIQLKGLSIIIPCYNVGKYITKCLDSISLQLDNIKYEIILVNDLSTDNTDKVIKNYLKDSKLSIISSNN